MELTLALVLALAFAATAFGGGEVVVVSTPPSARFSDAAPLPRGALEDVYSAVLGFSVERDREWRGLVVNDPFDLARAAVEVNVDGVASLGPEARLTGQRYALFADRAPHDLRERISRRFPSDGDRFVDVELARGAQALTAFGVVDVEATERSLRALEPDVNEDDYRFLRELDAMSAVADRVTATTIVPDNKIEFYRFTILGLHPLVDYHGKTSAAALEAETLLGEAVMNLTRAFKTAYDGNVLITVVTSDSSHTRRTRSLSDESPASRVQSLNIAKTYTANYPIIFNIIFWFSVILILTLIAVSYTIGDMDPGRDSIIYRMTSNRMKKEN